VASSIAIVISAESAGSRCDAAEKPKRMTHLVEIEINPTREKGNATPLREPESF
jgi:hypothetical protein